MLTDSIIGIEVPQEEITVDNNGSHEIQNTLMLDSHSLIIEVDNG
jgi:hypothetical protein